ncbi:hypothetical protein HY375_03270 [Candidatus Berkelbacteria bacterium]|nr:hypothetical protein [Candidatus Berkelbacteria bacterium]
MLTALSQGRLRPVTPSQQLATVFMLTRDEHGYTLSPPVTDEDLSWTADGARIALHWSDRGGLLDVDEGGVWYYWSDRVRRRPDRSLEAYQVRIDDRLEVAFRLAPTHTFEARFSLYIARPSRELDACQTVQRLLGAIRRSCQLTESGLCHSSFTDYEREVLQQGFAMLPEALQRQLAELGWQEADPSHVRPAMYEVVWRHLCQLEGGIGGATSDEGLPADEFTVEGTWDRRRPERPPVLTLRVHNLTPWVLQRERAAPFLRGMLGTCPSVVKSMIGDAPVERAVVELSHNHESTFLHLIQSEEWECLADELALWGQLVGGIRPKLRKLAKLLRGKEWDGLVWRR